MMKVPAANCTMIHWSLWDSLTNERKKSILIQLRQLMCSSMKGGKWCGQLIKWTQKQLNLCLYCCHQWDFCKDPWTFKNLYFVTYKSSTRGCAVCAVVLFICLLMEFFLLKQIKPFLLETSIILVQTVRQMDKRHLQLIFTCGSVR